jgi:tetratricopeptide (TPR) repeat protein
MSKLMTLLAEAKTNLHDLEDLLQKARALDPDKIADPLLTREEFQRYFDEILRIVEKIPENMKLEDSLQWKTEITRLHRDMEEARNKVEYSIDQLKSMCERNVKQLTEFIETLESREQAKSLEDSASHSVDTLPLLMIQGREYLKKGDHESCMKLMEAILTLSPNHQEAVVLKEAQRRWEDRRLEEELAIHIKNVKKEAMQLFDQEKFQECVGIFKFLCELDPTNLSLQDYLQLSRLKLEETEEKACQLQEQAVENKASTFANTIQNPTTEPGNDLRDVASIESSEEKGPSPDLHYPAQDDTSDKMVMSGIRSISFPS